jgi:hypothetical protein
MRRLLVLASMLLFIYPSAANGTSYPFELLTQQFCSNLISSIKDAHNKANGFILFDVDAYLLKVYPFLNKCSDKRVAMCLASMAHKGADGIYSAVSCINREYAYILASSPLRAYRVTESKAKETLYLADLSSADNVATCMIRVWFFDRKSWSVSNRACLVR